MLKLFTAVCVGFGMVVISEALNNGGVPPSFIPQSYAPIASSFQYRSNDFQDNHHKYSPVVPQGVDPASLIPNAFIGTKILPLWTMMTGLIGVHFPSKILGNLLTHVGAPVAWGMRDVPLFEDVLLFLYCAWGPRIIDNNSFCAKNIGKVPIMHRSPIPQMDVAIADPQVSPSQQQPSHCENSEILFKIWSIFFNLLDSGGEVKNPDMEKVKLALKLIKEYVQTAPRNPQNDEVALKLLTLEEALLQKKDIQKLNQSQTKEKNIPESKLAFDTVDDNIDIIDTVLSSSRRFPEMVKYPNCIEELAKIIQTAQSSYIQLTQSPVCKESLPSPDIVLRRDSAPTIISAANLTISQKQYKRASFNNIQNQNAKNNEALKSSLGFLMNQSDYNAHDVFELLQNFKPMQSTVDTVPVGNDTKPFNPNQTNLNSNLLASDFNASQTSYNHSQMSDNVAINDWTNYNKSTKIYPLNPNEIELTYALKRPQPLVYQPYYFIKYRLPFHSFLQNLGKVTQMKSTDTSKSELYKSVIQSWNADEISPDLSHYTKEQVNDLVIKEGNLVEALLIQNKDKNMQINLNTPENLEVQLSEYNSEKHLIQAQANQYYPSSHIDESRRRLVESNIRPGLDTPPRFQAYPTMFQKGQPPTPLKSYSDHLLYKSGFGKTLPAAHLPSPLIDRPKPWLTG